MPRSLLRHFFLLCELRGKACHSERRAVKSKNLYSYLRMKDETLRQPDVVLLREQGDKWIYVSEFSPQSICCRHLLLRLYFQMIVDLIDIGNVLGHLFGEAFRFLAVDGSFKGHAATFPDNDFDVASVHLAISL